MCRQPGNDEVPLQHERSVQQLSVRFSPAAEPLAEAKPDIVALCLSRGAVAADPVKQPTSVLEQGDIAKHRPGEHLREADRCSAPDGRYPR